MLSMCFWSKKTSTLSPSSATANCSAALNFREIFINGWVKKNMITVATMPPMEEQTSEMPSARPASPRIAMGYPSRAVAALDGVPGILNRIAVTPPPVMAEQ